VVEGHGPTRDLLEERLSAEGFAVSAPEPLAAWESFAAEWPAAVVMAADLPDAEGRKLVERLRAADPQLLLVVTDKAHLGRALGIHEVLGLRANAYVADPTSGELLERLRTLFAQSASSRSAPAPGSVARICERPPSEQGDVRQGEIAPLLLGLWRAGADGILEVEGRSSTRRLFLLRGNPVAFESDLREDRLGRWLVASGNLSEAQYRSALDVLAVGKLSEGAALVAAGAIGAGLPLKTAMRAHLCAMVSSVTGEREGRFRFHPGSEFEREVATVEVPALAPVLDGVRAALPARHFADALRAHLGAYPARTADFARLVPSMALGSSDLRLALGLDGHSTTRAFLEARRTDLRDALSLLWFLERAGALSFHEAPLEKAPYPYAASAGPARRQKPLPEERAEELRQAALRVLPGSYFQALGVDIAADIEEVERAYHEAATRFHPDGYVEFDVGPLEDLLAQVQEKLNAAYRVLSNEDKRRAYLSFLLSRAAAETGRRRPEVVPEAEVALKRGERALRARRPGDAAGFFREASERNPREPEYAALLAFATLVDRSLPRLERARAAARHARRALDLDPGCVRAQAFLALAEEAGGNVSEARRQALATLETAPWSTVARQVLRRLNRPR